MISRQLEPELLDHLPPDDPRAIRSRRDLRLINAWMGNARHLGWSINSLPKPPRTIVELGTGEVGIVISSKQLFRHLPKVMVLRDAEKKTTETRVVDLEQVAHADSSKKELIKTTLPNGSYGIRIEEYIRQGLRLL